MLSLVCFKYPFEKNCFQLKFLPITALLQTPYANRQLEPVGTMVSTQCLEKCSAFVRVPVGEDFFKWFAVKQANEDNRCRFKFNNLGSLSHKTSTTELKSIKVEYGVVG